MTTNLLIEGMTCDHCVNAATKALKSVPGVIDAHVTLTPGAATVEHDDSVDPQALVRAIEDEEFTARVTC